MRRARWIIKPESESIKPIIYHCISRVVNRDFVFESTEKEQLRMFMRMYEVFSGNRVLSYCFMSNHIHLLLEVTPAPADGLTDKELLRRLGAIHSEAQVAVVAEELATARKSVAEGLADESRVACRTMAAYIDLNPVRAGIVTEPAAYRWSSYGEAVGGGAKGNGKKAREGLVRACMSHEGAGFEAEKWQEVSRIYRRAMGLALGSKAGKAEVDRQRRSQTAATVAEMLESEDNETVLKDLGMAKMLRCRIRYFTDGAVIGSKEFVNEAFASARERFVPKRKDGARKLKGDAAPARNALWSLRDLRKGVA